MLNLFFRMKRETFDYILQYIKPALLRTRSGQKPIAPEKQFLIAIWKMATPDSYRYVINIIIHFCSSNF